MITIDPEHRPVRGADGTWQREVATGSTLPCRHEDPGNTPRIGNKACAYIEASPTMGGLWAAVRYLRATCRDNVDYCGSCLAQNLTAIDACAWAHGLSVRAREHVLGVTHRALLQKSSNLCPHWKPTDPGWLRIDGLPA